MRTGCSAVQRILCFLAWVTAYMMTLLIKNGNGDVLTKSDEREGLSEWENQEFQIENTECEAFTL